MILPLPEYRDRGMCGCPVLKILYCKGGMDNFVGGVGDPKKWGMKIKGGGGVTPLCPL